MRAAVRDVHVAVRRERMGRCSIAEEHCDTLWILHRVIENNLRSTGYATVFTDVPIVRCRVDVVENVVEGVQSRSDIGIGPKVDSYSRTTGSFVAENVVVNHSRVRAVRNALPGVAVSVIVPWLNYVFH